MMLAKQLGSMALGFLLAGALGACGLEEGPINPGGDGDVVRIPHDDPSYDQRLDDVGIVCQSTLNVTGTHTAGDPQPADENGCWAVGTWTINATVDFEGCDPQPELSVQYQYQVTRDDNSDSTIVFLNDPTNERLNLKVTTDSTSLCHGSFEHYLEDGTVWSFKPTLQEDGTLFGAGTYAIWEFDSF